MSLYSRRRRRHGEDASYGGPTGIYSIFFNNSLKKMLRLFMFCKRHVPSDQICPIFLSRIMPGNRGSVTINVGEPPDSPVYMYQGPTIAKEKRFNYDLWHSILIENYFQILHHISIPITTCYLTI